MLPWPAGHTTNRHLRIRKSVARGRRRMGLAGELAGVLGDGKLLIRRDHEDLHRAPRSTDAGLRADRGLIGGPVQLDGVFNARHTGGLTTADGQRVRDRVLIRSGALTSLTATGCEQLAALGIASVVDLRAAAVVAQEPDAECVASTAAYYNADLPKILPPTVESYLQTLDATEPTLPAIYGHLADHGLPAIIHCVIGRDRASMMMAIMLLSLGVPQDQVVADFEINQEADVDAAWLDGVLDRIEQAGGIESYLQSHGVTETQLATLRAAALE